MRLPFFLLLLSILSVVTSCDDNEINYPRPMDVSVLVKFPVYTIDKETVTEEQGRYIQKATVVNSEDELDNIFKVWDMETPEVLKGFNYESETLLLTFGAAPEDVISIDHKLSKKQESKDSYTYDYILTWYFRDWPLGDSLYFFYTCSLIKKIEENATIILWFSSTSSTI